MGIEVVDQGHQGGNGGIELHGLDILRHLFDGLVDSGLVGLGVLLAGVLLLGGQVPHPVQEALAATDGVVGPNRCLFKVADEHDIQAHGVRAVIPDHVVGVDHVAQRLGHLDRGTQGLIAVLFNECLLLLLGLHIAHIMGVLAQDHAVAGALGIGFSTGDDPDVMEEVVPEPGVEQMEGGMLHAAVVPVHLSPVLQGLLGRQSLVVVGIHIPQEVPAGAGPLGHGVGLALGRAAAAGAGGVYPVGHLGDGGFAVVSGLVALHLGQEQG